MHYNTYEKFKGFGWQNQLKKDHSQQHTRPLERFENKNSLRQSNRPTEQLTSPKHD